MDNNLDQKNPIVVQLPDIRIFFSDLVSQDQHQEFQAFLMSRYETESVICTQVFLFLQHLKQLNTTISIKYIAEGSLLCVYIYNLLFDLWSLIPYLYYKKLDNFYLEVIRKATTLTFLFRWSFEDIFAREWKRVQGTTHTCFAALREEGTFTEIPIPSYKDLGEGNEWFYFFPLLPSFLVLWDGGQQCSRLRCYIVHCK